MAAAPKLTPTAPPHPGHTYHRRAPQTRLLQLDQDILLNVRQAVRAVETDQESLRISTLATQLSDRQFPFEKARYDAGPSTFRRVQESQEDLDNARVNELQARVNLRIALSELARLEGSSLPRYKIVFADWASPVAGIFLQNCNCSLGASERGDEDGILGFGVTDRSNLQ